MERIYYIFWVVVGIGAVIGFLAWLAVMAFQAQAIGVPDWFTSVSIASMVVIPVYVGYKTW